MRMSIALAVLKHAAILILDEPTSAVDVKTEGVIVEAMERLMAGRTTFIIAHRLSTLQRGDLILKIEHGRVLSFESGASAPRAPAPREGGTVVFSAPGSEERLRGGGSM